MERLTTLDLLAHRIAYDYARSDIECHAETVAPGAGIRPRYNLSRIDEDYADEVNVARRYLDLRGLLVWHSRVPPIVSIADDDLAEAAMEVAA